MANNDAVLRYEPIVVLSREEALQQLALGGSSAVNAIYSIALHDSSDVFAENACLQALESADEKLRFAAVGAIGEMTVFANRRIDFERVESRLFQLKKDDPKLAGRIEDALDDFALAKSRSSEADGKKA